MRSASTTLLEVPSWRTAIGDRSFSIARPRVCNTLPASVRDINSSLRFRKLLKAFLFVWRPRCRWRWTSAFKYTYLLTYLLIVGPLCCLNLWKLCCKSLQLPVVIGQVLDYIVLVLVGTIRVNIMHCVIIILLVLGCWFLSNSYKTKRYNLDKWQLAVTFVVGFHPSHSARLGSDIGYCKNNATEYVGV